MGTRKKFSAAEQELLRANPYTEKVTEHQISFTLAFKEAFWRLSVEGCTGNMALRKLGYDPELLGFERVHNITKRIRRAGKSPEGIQPAPKSRMRISREQFGAAELEKMSRRESERRMQQEIVYLQQQMAFLKKPPYTSGSTAMEMPCAPPWRNMPYMCRISCTPSWRRRAGCTLDISGTTERRVSPRSTAVRNPA